ncbi:hypothetical protein ES703_22492 [subsurface metagenome]
MTVRSDVPNPLVHKVTLNPGDEVRKAKTKLDEVLDERESRAAQRYSAATMEQMAIDAENEVARARGEPPKYKHSGGDGMTDEEKEKKKQEEAEQREQLMASATALINSGLDPKQVGQMLLGLTPTPMGAGYPSAQGMGFEEVLKIVTLIVGKRETDEIKGLMASLDKRIDELAKGGGGGKVEVQRPPTPMEYAKQQVEYINALKELGIIKEPVVTGSSGEPLEIVRERNRHEEKMEEVRGERDYKQSLAETVADLPERLGRGIAGQFTEEAEGRGGSHSSSLEYIICDECKTKFPIPPNAGNQVECPKCKSVYTRGAAAEPETK